MMSHGWTCHRSTGIRGRYHIASPSLSGMKTLNKVCEEYATEFDVTLNGEQVSCCFSVVENVYFLI